MAGVAFASAQNVGTPTEGVQVRRTEIRFPIHLLQPCLRTVARLLQTKVSLSLQGYARFLHSRASRVFFVPRPPAPLLCRWVVRYLS